MSDTPSKEPLDPLLAALRQLPTRTVDGDHESRLQRQARAAFTRRFEGSGWDSPLAGFVGKAAVPVFLAGIVGLYMTWAIAAATALVQ
jgi:hypothetical protein